MNTLFINDLCQKDQFISKYYIGCLACDQLPETFPDYSLAIVNLDKIQNPGLHWIVCASLDNNRSLYIDSFGRPLKNKYIYNSLKNRGKPIVHNNVPLQHFLSQYCGFFSIFFCYFLARNFSMEEILLNYFTPSKPIYNDLLVKNFIKIIFSLKTTPPFLHKEKLIKHLTNTKKEKEGNLEMAGGSKFLAIMTKMRKKKRRKEQKGMGINKRGQKGRGKGTAGIKQQRGKGRRKGGGRRGVRRQKGMGGKGRKNKKKMTQEERIKEKTGLTPSSPLGLYLNRNT